MRPFRSTVAVLLMCPALAAAQSASSTASAPTADVTPTVSVTAGTEWIASSAYIWRGFVPNDEFVVQPNTWVRVGRVTVASWMNVLGTADDRHLTEHDLTVDYSQQAGAFT